MAGASVTSRWRGRCTGTGPGAGHRGPPRADHQGPAGHQTGLTCSSVSSIVGELLSARLVVEQGAQRGGDLGRPGTALTLARDGMVALGLEVNVDYLAACVVDPASADPGPVRGGRRQPGLRPGGRGRAVGAAGRGQRPRPGPRGDRPATCVAVPGLVDQETGTVVRAPNLDWSGVPLRRRLAGRAPSCQPQPGRERGQRGCAGEWSWDVASATTCTSPARSGWGRHRRRRASCSAAPTGTPASSATPPRSRTGGLHLRWPRLPGAVLWPGGDPQEGRARPGRLDSTGRSDGPVGRPGRPRRRRPPGGGRLRGRGRTAWPRRRWSSWSTPDTVVLGGIYAVLAPWLRAPFQRRCWTASP